MLPHTAGSEHFILPVTFLPSALDSKLNKEVELFLVITHRTMKVSAQYSEAYYPALEGVYKQCDRFA